MQNWTSYSKFFLVGETYIETCCEYKYLGFRVTPYGGISSGLKDLKDRGIKALYKIRQQLGPLFLQHPKVTIKIFDTLVKPILLYASDFWGILKFPKNNPIENVHIKFCKELLKVQKQTTNIGVLLELGQIPISIFAIKNAIKNWVRISNTEKKELLNASYLNSISEDLSWPTQIKNVLSRNGMFDHFITKDINTHVRIFQRLSDLFHQNAFHQIGIASSKLRTYNLIKTNIGYENYLDEIQNLKHRNALTKLRLSNHNLMIEKGRHNKTEIENRFCPFCLNLVEDEIHFLLICKTFREIRCPIVQPNLDPYSLNTEQLKNRFIYLIKKNTKIKEIARCIYTMFQCRDYLLTKPRQSF